VRVVASGRPTFRGRGFVHFAVLGEHHAVDLSCSLPRDVVVVVVLADAFRDAVVGSPQPPPALVTRRATSQGSSP